MKLKEKLEEMEAQLNQPQQMSQEAVNNIFNEDHSRIDYGEKEEHNIDLINDIKAKPIPKGFCQTTILGDSVDWRDLERYTLKISPSDIKSALKTNEAQMIGMFQKYQRPSDMLKGAPWFLIIMVGIIAVVGILMLMFGPQLMQGMQGFVP